MNSIELTNLSMCSSCTSLARNPRDPGNVTGDSGRRFQGDDTLIVDGIDTGMRFR